MMIDKVVADTLQTAAATADTLHALVRVPAEHGEKFDFSHLLEHLYDSSEIEIPFGHVDLPHFPPIHVGGFTIDLSITKHVFFLLFAGLLLTLMAVYASRKIRRNPVPTGFANLVEILVVFIRDEVVLPTMGPAGEKYVPFILTTFLYILIMNLLGLIPFGASATGNVSVTAGLAFVAFIMIQVAAIRAQGFTNYLAHFTAVLHGGSGRSWFPLKCWGSSRRPSLCACVFLPT